MRISSFIAAGLLLSFAAAVPFGKRDLVWYTVTDEVVETVVVYTTVWLPAGQAPVAVTTTEIQAKASLPVADPTTTTPAPIASVTTTAPAPPPPPPTTTTTPAPPPPSTTTPAPPPPPPTTTTPPPPPPPQPPTTAAAPAPVATTQAAAAAGNSYPTTILPGASIPDGCSSSKPCSGDMTYYTPDGGLGACGDTLQNTDLIVAISVGMMGSLSNAGPGAPTNPLCGRTIQITDPTTGKSTTAKVADKCEGCLGPSDIDLAPPVFTFFYPEGVGRVHNMEWVFI
ncbi:MAG: hypothetical protein MMC33_006047 [Icmadophila ericetorum]|nr:hypothetical protein [Icmadophila ericetorum]